MGMKVKYITKDDNFPNIKRQLELVNGTGVEVGVLKGEHKWLAGIHEYGAHIKPGKAQYLTVPVTPEAVGRRAGSFSDTFVLTTDDGKKFIAQKSGDDVKLLYWLTKSVTIPERAFLRGGYDAHKDAVAKKAEMILADVATGKTTSRGLHQAVGLALSSKIKEYARNLDSPPNRPITVENKGSSNPLVDSGDMIGGITWRISK